MNILVVTQFPIPHGGGLSVHIEELLNCFRIQNYQYELIDGRSLSLSQYERKVLMFLSLGIRDIYRKNIIKKSISSLCKLITSKINSNSFNMIHCHDPIASYAASLVIEKTRRNIPIVETIHGPLMYESKMMIKKEINESKYLQYIQFIESQAYSKSKHLIAVDSGQAEIAVADYNIIPQKVSIIFNSVSCKNIADITNNSKNNRSEKPYILVPRRLVTKSGVDIAIKALVELKKESVDIDLIIAGDGPLRKELEKLRKDLRVSSNVHFLGSIPRDKVLELAKNALAVLVPSIPSDGVVEATSIAAIEAMACGTVVIASNVGGLAEIIENSKTGYLVPHSQPKEISNIIQNLINDLSLLKEIGNNARKFVQSNLDTKQWFEKIEAVYGNVLN